MIKLNCERITTLDGLEITNAFVARAEGIVRTKEYDMLELYTYDDFKRFAKDWDIDPLDVLKDFDKLGDGVGPGSVSVYVPLLNLEYDTSEDD